MFVIFRALMKGEGSSTLDRSWSHFVIVLLGHKITSLFILLQFLQLQHTLTHQTEPNGTRIETKQKATNHPKTTKQQPQPSLGQHPQIHGQIYALTLPNF